MTTPPRLNLPAAVEEQRQFLSRDLLNADATRQLRDSLNLARTAPPPDGPLPEPALSALLAVCTVLDGDGLSNPALAPSQVPGVLDRTTHEALVVHPHEKQQRQHQAASLLARLLHALDGNVMAHTVTRVAEKARELAGCDELACLADIAAQVNTDWVLSSSLGSVGGRWVINLSLIDARRSQVAASDSVTAAGAAELQ